MKVKSRRTLIKNNEVPSPIFGLCITKTSFPMEYDTTGHENSPFFSSSFSHNIVNPVICLQKFIEFIRQQLRLDDKDLFVARGGGRGVGISLGLKSLKNRWCSSWSNFSIKANSRISNRPMLLTNTRVVIDFFACKQNHSHPLFMLFLVRQIKLLGHCTIW